MEGYAGIDMVIEGFIGMLEELRVQVPKNDILQS